MKYAVLLFALLLAIVPSVALADPGNGNGRWSHEDADGSSVSIDLASGLAALGQVDPNVTVLPAGGTSQSAVVCSARPGSWAAPLQDTNWISTLADCNASLSAIDYTYTITFNLASNSGPLRLDGSVLADDSVIVRLNGHDLFNGGGFAQSSSFSTADSTWFVTGTNSLTFVVHNVTGPSGLDFRASVRGGTAVVDDDGGNNHGQCVSAVAHETPRGRGHGKAVSEAARVSCWHQDREDDQGEDED